MSFHPNTKAQPRLDKLKVPGAGTFSLGVVGNTHRAYEGAMESVMSRAPAAAPPAPDVECLPADKWLEEQKAITASMTEAYGQAATPKQALQEESVGKPEQLHSSGYVPKPRKTVRSKQAPNPTTGLIRPVGLGQEKYEWLSYSRLKTGRRNGRTVLSSGMAR